MNVKNLEKSTKLSEFLKLHSVLKFTTSSGKKFQMLTTLVIFTVNKSKMQYANISFYFNTVNDFSSARIII